MIGSNVNNKRIINAAVGLGLGFALTALFKYGYNQYSGADYRQMLTETWKTVKYGAPFIQLETPVGLKSSEVKLNDEARELLESQQSFAYQAGFDLTITATIVKYHEDVYFDPEGAENSVLNFEHLYGAKEISFETEDFEMNAYKAKRLTGSFRISGRQYDFTRVCIESGQVVRDILVIVKLGDKEGHQVMDRIVDSIDVE